MLGTIPVSVIPSISPPAMRAYSIRQLVALSISAATDSSARRWCPPSSTALSTVARDHAHCSLGSYTHGFIPLEQAAAGADTAALVGSGWVSA